MYFTIWAIKWQNARRIKNGTSEHGTVRLFASFGKINKMTSPEAGKVYGCQADWMIDRYQGSLLVPVSSSNKIFSEKVDFVRRKIYHNLDTQEY